MISQLKCDVGSKVALAAVLNESRHPAGWIIQEFLSKLEGQRQGQGLKLTIKLLSRWTKIGSLLFHLIWVIIILSLNIGSWLCQSGFSTRGTIVASAPGRFLSVYNVKRVWAVWKSLEFYAICTPQKDEGKRLKWRGDKALKGSKSKRLIAENSWFMFRNVCSAWVHTTGRCTYGNESSIHSKTRFLFSVKDILQVLQFFRTSEGWSKCSKSDVLITSTMKVD